MSQITMKEKTWWKRIFFSPTVLSKNQSRKMAYIAMLTAFSVVANIYDIPLSSDNKLSLTIVVSLLTGLILGAVFGFGACVLGDFIGFLMRPGQIYMPWVGLSTGAFAFFAGILFYAVSSRKKWVFWLKLFVICLVTFLVCTVCINSVGFYFYNKQMGFSTAVLDYVAQKFGGNVSFWSYIVYRLIFKGQIFYSLLNYTLFFLAVPALRKVKALSLSYTQSV